jgi:hypothetical protein
MIYLAFSYYSIITEECQQRFQIGLRTTDNMKHSDLTVHEIGLEADAVELAPNMLHNQKNIG